MKKKSSNAWLVVALLWMVALLNYLDRLMLSTMRESIKESIVMSDAQFGLLTAVFLWVYGMCSPLGGYLADRFSRRIVILGSLAIWSGVTWWTGHVKTFEGLLFARGIMGISEACYIPAALALIADYHRGPTRSLATGVHMSGIYVGAALGGLGGYVAELWGWRVAFNIFGGIGVCYAGLLLFLLKEAPASEERVDTGTAGQSAGSLGNALVALFAVPVFRILLLVSGLVGIANWTISAWLPTYLGEHFHLGIGAAGMSATGYIQTAAFVGVLAGGVWADRWSCFNSGARGLVSAIGFAVAGPFLFLAASVNQLPWALLGLVITGISRGLFDANLMPMVREWTGERTSATGYGVLNLISCASGGVMVYVGGSLKDANFDLGTVFKVSAAGLVFVSGLLFLMKPKAFPFVR